MRKERLIIVCSILLPLNAWIIDALLISFIYDNESFYGRLISDVPGYEMLTRFAILLGFVACGIIISNMSIKTKRAEDAMRRYRHEVEALKEIARIMACDLPVQRERQSRVQKLAGRTNVSRMPE